MGEYSLGLDIGTTSVKVTVLNARFETAYTHSTDHGESSSLADKGTNGSLFLLDLANDLAIYLQLSHVL